MWSLVALRFWGYEVSGGGKRTLYKGSLTLPRISIPELTIQILIFDSPGLGRVKVGVASDVGAWEVGVCEEATLAIEGCAVAMETLSKHDHDVGMLMAILDVGIGYLSETQRRVTLPHSECLADGFICAILAYLGGVILDAEVQSRGEGIRVC